MNTVFTVGYEGTDIDRFITTLKTVGVEAIADVRAVPLSRKKGFSKNALADALQAAGIDYLPFKDLGDPKEGRDAAKAGKYRLFEKIYGDYLQTKIARDSLARLSIQADKKTICLLCFERDYQTCHRNMIAHELEKKGFPIFNLYADDPARYLRNPIIAMQKDLLLEAAE